MMDAPEPPAKRPISVRVLASAFASLFPLTLALRLWWIEPWFPKIAPKGLSAAPFAAFFALGIALILTLAHANRHRWRAVLRPNWGRIIGAVVLALLTPIAVFSWAPWVLGGLLVFGAFLLLEEGSPEVLLTSLAFVTAATGLWYPAAALIVSGLRSRYARVAAFTLMFWTAYSAVILTLGTKVFML